jgi:DNA-binding transcriptional ArsR family regulator
MVNDSEKQPPMDSKVQDLLEISDPKVIRIILHEQKMLILHELILNMKNIQELSDATKLNPGTVKRNLDELIENHLVHVAEVRKSEYNITMKYYEATMKKIKIRFDLPLEDVEKYRIKKD